jgi:hypothetical protein
LSIIHIIIRASVRVFSGRVANFSNGGNEKKLEDFTYINTLLDGKCQDFGQGTGFQDGWRHLLKKIDGWHATRATRSNAL